MSFAVRTSISPKAAAKLLISNEMDLDDTWSNGVAEKVISELLELSTEDIFRIIDSNSFGLTAEAKYIPQFGKIDTVIGVPSYFAQTGSNCADYPQLGLYLKKDATASLVANTKFGENHGKAASIMGMACCVDRRIIPSALSFAFCEMSTEQKHEVALRLLFRIPIVQILLSTAKTGLANGYAPMSQLKESTRHRRSQCLRAIFKIFDEMNNPELSRRIKNIVWEDEKGD